ncbi:MAG: integrase core domain-containing protein [Patescibacteria group bacterium]
MISETAKKRARILTFWKTHGLAATIDAHDVRRRTLFEWQRRLKNDRGKLESLNSRSKAPKKRRRRLRPPEIIEEIKRLRFEHKNLGKEKLHPLLVPYCATRKLACPKPKTIGRIVKDLGGLRVVPERITGTGRVNPIKRLKTTRKPHGFVARYPGHCVALDTFEEHINGSRRYVITFIDLYTRFGYALATTSHASLAAEEFFSIVRQIFPFPFTNVLTDNGSEFKKHFADTTHALHLTHYKTRPRTPKQNAHCERFNRTVQDEYANYHRRELLFDIPSFNAGLNRWNIWYNTKRVHHAFKNKQTPLQFMLSLDPSTLPPECRNGWPHTIIRNNSAKMLKSFRLHFASGKYSLTKISSRQPCRDTDPCDN